MSLVALLEQETFWGLSGPRPKRLLAPSLLHFREKQFVGCTRGGSYSVKGCVSAF